MKTYLINKELLKKVISSTITKDINDYVKVVVSPKGYLSFTDLFNKYEIEVEGEFKPFGVTDET